MVTVIHEVPFKTYTIVLNTIIWSFLAKYITTASIPTWLLDLDANIHKSV